MGGAYVNESIRWWKSNNLNFLHHQSLKLASFLIINSLTYIFWLTNVLTILKAY